MHFSTFLTRRLKVQALSRLQAACTLVNITRVLEVELSAGCQQLLSSLTSFSTTDTCMSFWLAAKSP
jgi:hypothetical protein